MTAEAALGGWQIGLDAGLRTKALRSTSFFGGRASGYDYDIGSRSQSLRARRIARGDDVTNSFVIGMDHERWTRDVAGAFGSSAASQASRAYYLSDELAFASGTRLSAGLRTERLEKSSSVAPGAIDGRQKAWQLGVVQTLGSGATVFGRVGRSFRLPNVDEIGATLAGATLRPQSSRDIELGLRWTPPGGRAELRLYRNSITDEIGFDPAAPGPVFPGANVNFDPTRRQGAELELAQALDAAWRLRLNAALRQSRFTAGPYAGREVPLTARRTIALRLEWASLPAGQRFDAGLTAVSAQHPDFDNACTIPGRAVADMRYAWRVSNAEFALGVANLANRRHYTQAFGCDAGVTTSIYPEAGRAFTGSARFSF